MSDYYLSSAPETQQQQGSLTLKEFAKLNNLSNNQAFNLAKRGLILGACKTHGERWLVFPPAKLLHRPKPSKPRQAKPKACAGFGTSPHGLPANVHPMQPEGSRNDGSQSLADGFGVDVPNGGADLRAQASCTPPSQTVVPEVFGNAQVKAAARTIALGGSTLCYPVVLTGRQILAIEKAVAHDLNGLEQQADWHEFEPEQAALHDSERATLQATLRVIRNATAEVNQANARTQRTGAWR